MANVSYSDPRRVVFILGFMAFWVNGDSHATAPLLVEIAKDLDLSMSQAALSVATYMVPFGLFTLVFGPLADRYGKARVINLAAFATAAFSALGALVSDLASLCLIRALNGVFAAAVMPVAISLVGDSFKSRPQALQGGLNKVFGMAFLGSASGVAIGGALAFFGSWRLVYLFFGLAELIVAAVMLKVLPKEPGTTSRFNLKEAYEAALSNRRLLKVVGVIFLMGLSVFGCFAFTGKCIESRTGYSVLAVGLMLTLFGLSAMLSTRIAPFLRKLFGTRLFLVAGLVACLSLAVMAVAQHPAVLSLCLAGVGAGFVLIQPVLVALAQESMPNRRGTVMSVASFAMLTGGGLGASLDSALLSTWGYEAVFGLAAILVLVAGVLTTMLTSSGQRAEADTCSLSSKPRNSCQSQAH